MIYRKRGSVVRWENGTLLRVTENGVAIEEGERFECRPEQSASLRVVDSAGVLATVRRIHELAGALSIERLIVMEGVAEHECEGREWTEETSRFHLSIVHGELRALIDSATRRLDDIEAIAKALARAESCEREPPAHLRLAPCVTAALLPALGAGGRVVQTAGGVDGYGHPIIESAGDEWPNWYRPSYRMRPVRMPLNVRIECEVAGTDSTLARAIALLAPPQGNRARVLIVDGDRVYPSQIQVTGVVSSAPERIWYPYGGGSFGAELVL